jgi:NAD(P)-dependent dehydrogenase (short-subunit alcohol dehydrogenase family)
MAIRTTPARVAPMLGTMPDQTRPTTALITGASRGLGLGIAQALALEHRSRVALVAREPSALERAVASIRAAGGEAIGIVADVADKRAIHTIAGQAAAALGDIDVLVNNASSLGPTPLRSLLDSECEDFEATLAANLLGPFRLSKAVLGSMVLRGRGVVVQISSDAAVEAYPDWGLYGVSKAALDQLTRIWAAELDGTGVRMFAVDPGEMNTRMHADALPDADPSTLADPLAVGRTIAAMIMGAAPTGARLQASAWPTADREVA